MWYPPWAWPCTMLPVVRQGNKGTFLSVDLKCASCLCLPQESLPLHLIWWLWIVCKYCLLQEHADVGILKDTETKWSVVWTGAAFLNEQMKPCISQLGPPEHQLHRSFIWVPRILLWAGEATSVLGGGLPRKGKKGDELRYCLIVMIAGIMIQQLQIFSIFLVDWWNHHAMRGFWYDETVHWHWQVPLSLYQSQGVVTQSVFFGPTKNRYVMELQSH